MPRTIPPAAQLGTQLATLWVESAVVVTLRMVDLAWRGTGSPETERMVMEKPPAFVDAGGKALSVALSALWARPYDPYGAYLDAASAYTASVTRNVRRNRRRLIRS